MRENWQGRSDLAFKLKWGLKNLDADGGNGHRENTNNSNAGKTTNDRPGMPKMKQSKDSFVGRALTIYVNLT